MSSDLKPCPFCRGEASANGRVSYSGLHQAWWPDGTQVLKSFHVNCMSCGCSNQGMFGHQTQGDAITAWNTRAAPKVKPLVWVEHEGGFEAEDFRIYNLENERREIWRLLQADFHTQYRGDFGGKSGLEEARKTAQIIHSRRFISALDTGEAS